MLAHAVLRIEIDPVLVFWREIEIIAQDDKKVKTKLSWIVSDFDNQNKVLVKQNTSFMSCNLSL